MLPIKGTLPENCPALCVIIIGVGAVGGCDSNIMLEVAEV
jgi:hypothetical protein